MKTATHEIELVFENEESLIGFEKCLSQINTESLTITDMETGKGMGIVGELFLIQFVANVLANVGSGLLANAIYDSFKKGEEAGEFSVTIDGVEVTCRTIEDVEKLIALKNSETSSE